MSNKPWAAGGLPELNVAATCLSTYALGPGPRAVVWVQGCPMHCRGCIAPDWIPFRIERLITPQALADELLESPDFTGLTLSGGEPMLQAAGLAELIVRVRQSKDVSVICFSGFTLEQLRIQPPGPGTEDLLAHTDVLIDGTYVDVQNNSLGLRGSTNQRIHHLSQRLNTGEYDFENQRRSAEIHLTSHESLLVGIPPPGVLHSFRSTFGKIDPEGH